MFNGVCLFIKKKNISPRSALRHICNRRYWDLYESSARCWLFPKVGMAVQAARCNTNLLKDLTRIHDLEFYGICKSFLVFICEAF